MRRILSILSLSAMLMVGCQKEDIITPDSNANYPADGVVRIATNINTPVTRATATDYDGENLSLTVSYGTGDAYTRNNIEWTNAGGTWSTAYQMLWKNATTAAKVYAYAPYVASQTNLEAISFSAQVDQSIGSTASDLVGYVNENFTPGSSLDASKKAIPIVFDHKMSKISVKLTFGDEFGATAPTLTWIRVLAQNSVTYDATTATATALGGLVTITPTKTNDTNYSVVVAPQTIVNGTKLFVVAINGLEYSYTTTKDQSFLPNTATTISLRIGKDKITLVDNITVGDWVDGGDLSGGEAVIPPIMLADFAIGGRYETVFPKSNTWVIEDIGAPAHADFRVLTARLIASIQLINLKFPNLTELPDAVESVGVFEKATKIKSFDAPKLTKIGTYAFYHCSGLTGNLTIPNSVTSIGNMAFKGCNLLKTVTCLGETPPTIYAETFAETTGLTSILVPSASVGAYQVATNWSTYAGIISAIQ